jgi:hypothetical protein
MITLYAKWAQISYSRIKKEQITVNRHFFHRGNFYKKQKNNKLTDIDFEI